MTTEAESDDSAAVVDAFIAGDERALARVYARWSPLVYSVALRTLDDADAAEQVTQSVFTHAWQQRCSFDPERTRLPIWLIGITREEILAVGTDDTAAEAATDPAGTEDENRADGAERAGTDLAGSGGRIASTDLADRLMLTDEISHLEPVAQQVLRLALYEGLTHEEIAERTHLPTSTVKNHIEQSLLKLRERLEVKTDAR